MCGKRTVQRRTRKRMTTTFLKHAKGVKPKTKASWLRKLCENVTAKRSQKAAIMIYTLRTKKLNGRFYR